MSEIDAIRALLTAKPRPVGWSERRARIDEIGATWPVAPDVQLEEVECDSVPGEWSIVPGSDTTRVLLFFHGGGYCSGSIVSHRRMVTEAGRAARMRTLAVRYRLAPEHPYPAAHEDAMTAWRFLRGQGIAACDIVVGGDSAGGNLTVTLINQLRAEADRPQGPADLAVVCRLARFSASARPGGLGGDIDGRFRAFCARGGPGRRQRHAAGLAAHDPCLADV